METMSKLFINETEFDLSVTLHIRKGFHINGFEYGTVNFELRSKDQLEVSYGDMENGYLNGVSCSASIEGRDVSYTERVKEVGCPLDQLLNHKDTLHISLSGTLLSDKAA